MSGRPPKGRERAYIQLSPDLIRRLDALAEVRACSRSDIAEDLLLSALDSAERATQQLPDFSGF